MWGRGRAHFSKTAGTVWTGTEVCNGMWGGVARRWRPSMTQRASSTHRRARMEGVGITRAEEAMCPQDSSVTEGSVIQRALYPECFGLRGGWGKRPAWISLTAPWPGEGLTGGTRTWAVTLRLMRRSNVSLGPGVTGRLDLDLLPRPG